MNAAPVTKTATKVLIIEDEGQISLILNILLDGKGIECDHVKTIWDAQEYLESNQPGLIILDNKLPDGFGLNIIPMLKFDFPDTGIIMMSGDVSSEDAALELGADIFLPKPFTMEQLHHAIQKLMP
jgi:two-component system, OmpR family, response regulator